MDSISIQVSWDILSALIQGIFCPSLVAEFRPIPNRKSHILSRTGRYYRDTGTSHYFISVIRIVIQFGRIEIFSSLFIVTIRC